MPKGSRLKQINRTIRTCQKKQTDPHLNIYALKVRSQSARASGICDSDRIYFIKLKYPYFYSKVYPLITPDEKNLLLKILSHDRDILDERYINLFSKTVEKLCSQHGEIFEDLVNL